MGIYTRQADPAIDAHVDRDLARIVATIRAAMHDVECIILVGSFSRGAVIITVFIVHCMFSMVEEWKWSRARIPTSSNELATLQ